MTARAGASSACKLDWRFIEWPPRLMQVRRLQMRIAKAYQQGQYGKVKALQWILTHSFSAKLLSVKRVTQNKGAKTPGVDGVVWKTPEQRVQAACALKRHGYQTKPLKRIYIPKKQKGKLRPLSIPVMACRAQQALYLLALEPIAEITADQNAYGFRPLRSTADAIEQCFNSLARKVAAEYILEGDIRDCFGSISGQWLLENTPMDKRMLGKWLTAGYMEKEKFYPTDHGTPQGSPCSPCLLTVTLRGLEAAVKAATSYGDKVNVCVYADDFIITGVSREVLERKVKPVVEAFLMERGLELSQEKTRITHIRDGFDFLGMNVRKYGNKLLIKPSKSGVKRFLSAIREVIKLNATALAESVITLLNNKIRGWANYYRHVCAKETFSYVDSAIFEALWRWAVRRHPNKSAHWIKQRYFRKDGLRNWVFSTKVMDKLGQIVDLDLEYASRTRITRHIKIKAEATPFDATYHAYLSKRITRFRREKSEATVKLDMWLCWWELLLPKQETGKTGSPQAALQQA